MKTLLLQILCICLLVILVSSYTTYSALNSIVFTNIDEANDTVFSEYFYGKCATRYKTLVIHDHLTYDDIKGKLIIRGYLDTPQNITCIYVRSESSVPEMVKYKPTRFTMCLSKIRYQYTKEQKFIHFYEWFVPSFMRPGIDWDLFFFVS